MAANRNRNRMKPAAQLAKEFDEPNALLDDILALGDLSNTTEPERRKEIVEVLKQHDLDFSNNTWREPLLKYFVDWVEAHNQVSFQRGQTNRLKALFDKLGEVNNTNTPNTVTFNNKFSTPMRAALTEHFTMKRPNGQTLGEYLSEKSAITNKERTKEQNNKQEAKRVERQRKPYTISLERITKLLSDLYRDTLADRKYSVFLLLELIAGCRNGESIMASKFSKGKLTKTGVQFIDQLGVFKKRDAAIPYKQYNPAAAEPDDVPDESDDEDADGKQQGGARPTEKYDPHHKLTKPMLQFPDQPINVELVLQKLAAARQELDLTPGTYDIRKVNTIGHACRRLLAERYISKRKNDLRVSATHLLRAIYVNTAYLLYVKSKKLPVTTPDAFIHTYLGHGSMNVARSYSDVVIQEPDEGNPDPPSGKKGAVFDDAEPADIPDNDPPQMPERDDNIDAPLAIKNRPAADDVEQPNANADQSLEQKYTALLQRFEQLEARQKRTEELLRTHLGAILNGL